jgi:hypothetical protein
MNTSSPEVAQTLLDEVAEAAPAAIEATLADLPEGFPEALATSIVDGMRRRLRLLEYAEA